MARMRRRAEDRGQTTDGGGHPGEMRFAVTSSVSQGREEDGGERGECGRQKAED